MLVYYLCLPNSEKIQEKLVTVVASRKGNWALGGQGEEEDLFFTLLYLSNLINIDYITSLKINIL